MELNRSPDFLPPHLWRDETRSCHIEPKLTLDDLSAKDENGCWGGRDVTISGDVARRQRSEGMAPGWNADAVTRAFCQRRCAAMSPDLMVAVADNGRSQ